MTLLQRHVHGIRKIGVDKDIVIDKKEKGIFFLSVD